MGASTAMFYLSERYRVEINQSICIDNSYSDLFQSPKNVTAVVYDSPFDDICKCIQTLIQNKNRFVPGFAID